MNLNVRSFLSPPTSHRKENIITLYMFLLKPSTECNTRLIFKPSLKALTSEFSFSLTSCYMKVTKPNLPFAQSAGAVEYTNCFSAERLPPHPTPKRVSWYDTKQSNGDVPVILELWRMRSTLLLPLLPGPLWPGMVAPDRALSMC